MRWTARDGAAYPEPRDLTEFLAPVDQELFIGVDGGGTSCRARIRNAAGTLRGEGSGGPANVRLDPALVMDSIVTATRAAVRAAGLAEGDLSRAHAGLGLAGAGLKSACQSG